LPKNENRILDHQRSCIGIGCCHQQSSLHK
jgi:hypothetical protein